MRSTFVTLLILVTLPFLAALGHDLWLFYENQHKGFLMSEVGFLWKRYDPESFKTAREILSAKEWNTLNSYILDQKTIILTGIFAIFFYVILIGGKLLSNTSNSSGGSISNKHKNKKVDMILGDAKQKKYSYKRK